MLAGLFVVPGRVVAMTISLMMKLGTMMIFGQVKDGVVFLVLLYE